LPFKNNPRTPTAGMVTFESFSSVLKPKDHKSNKLKQILGRVKRGASKDDLLSSKSLNGNPFGGQSNQDQHKLINGDCTYTFLM